MEDRIQQEQQQQQDDDDDGAIAATARALYQGEALAPMVRASTTPLRVLALDYGASFVYTEELVDRSLSQTIRVVNNDLGTIDYVKDPASLSKKTQKKLAKENDRPCLILRIDPRKEGNKLVCQLGSGEPELAVEAAMHVYRDVAAIDINMGCPKKFSVSGGMGSALLKDPDRACRIIETLRKAIPRPISCKIRLLESVEKTVDFVDRVIQAGVHAVAIHGRRVGDDATVAADWTTLENVLGILRRKYPTFPLLVNGDFYDRNERKEFLERTKASGILLGRPALFNVSTFVGNDNHPILDKTTVAQEYLKLSIRYDIHFKNSKYVVCEMMTNRRTPTDRVPYLPIEFPGGQTIAKTCNCQSMERMCQVWQVDYAIEAARVTTTGGGATGVDRDKDKVYHDYSTEQNEASAFITGITTNTTTTLVAGEHKYEDSYFLSSNPKRDADHLSSSGAEDTIETISGTGLQEPNAAKRSKFGGLENCTDSSHAESRSGQLLTPPPSS
jgi:tRNA-dihydrouridine synthase 2